MLFCLLKKKVFLQWAWSYYGNDINCVCPYKLVTNLLWYWCTDAWWTESIGPCGYHLTIFFFLPQSYRFLTKLMYFTPCAPPTIMTLCCASAGGAMENTLAHPQAPLLNPSPALASEEHAETEEYVRKIVLLSVCRRNMPPHSCCWLNPSNNTRLVLCSYERRSVTDPETFSPQNQEKCPNRKIRNK